MTATRITKLWSFRTQSSFCFAFVAWPSSDEYFEPSLGTISEKLGLTEDVAGATFMAAGSSAPELFTSVSDAFLTKNSVGIGTIVGSAMFNILIIVAMSAAVTKGAVKVDWRPIARDVGYYSLSIGMLAVFMLNQGDVCLKPVVGASGELNLTGVRQHRCHVPCSSIGDPRSLRVLRGLSPIP